MVLLQSKRIDYLMIVDPIQPNKKENYTDYFISSTAIILTTTVYVKKKIDCIYQSDSNERLSLYLKSILQWLEKTKFTIIVVENSGYSFPELSKEKEMYKNRFEVISFIEANEPDAQYLKKLTSKGASEIFAINYAYKRVEKLKNATFIIKITGRYYIPELESYLETHQLNDYDCLTQYNRDRCEMVGSHQKNFSIIFDVTLRNKRGYYDGHIENIWKERTSAYNNILICKKFDIETTQTGGLYMKNSDI